MENIEEKKATLRQYASLKEQAKQIADQIEMMQPEIELIVVELDPTDKKVTVADLGVFFMKSKKKYTYTEATQMMEKNLKATQKDEQASGAATYVDNPYVQFDSAVIE
jgi:hypothetical protein